MDPYVLKEYTAPALSNLKDLGWERKQPHDNDKAVMLLHQEPVLWRPLAGTPQTNKAKQKQAGHLRSLWSMSLRVAARNIQHFDDNYLESLPMCEWVGQMWDELGAEQGNISLEAWKKFNKYLPGEDQARESQTLRHYFTDIQTPTASDFTVYLDPLRSTASYFDFLAHLRIAGPCHITERDLMLLPQLRNLGVLELVEPSSQDLAFPRPSNHMIKAWSSQEDPFPQLRILNIISLDQVTQRCLSYLDRFPKLALFEVVGTPKHWRDWESWDASFPAWASVVDFDVRRGSNYRTPGRVPSRCSRHRRLAKYMANDICADEPSRGHWAHWACAAIDFIARDGAGPSGMDVAHDELMRQFATPMVSLRLGQGERCVQARPSRIRGLQRIFFWRRSLFPGPDAPPSPGRAGDRPAAVAPQPEKRPHAASVTDRKASTASSSGARASKRRRVGSLQSILEGFRS